MDVDEEARPAIQEPTAESKREARYQRYMNRI